MADESEKLTIAIKPNPYTTLLDNDKNTILHYSSARGRDDDFAKKSIKNQNLDVENYLGWTPLMMACKNGRISIVKALLDLGADATKFNHYGMSVFLISVAGGNLEIIKIILEHLLAGGISKRIMQRILSPLSLSILFRHHVVLEYLITQQFDLNAATSITGVTPLMFSSAMDDNHALMILLRNKADIKLKSHLGDTAQDIKKSRYGKQEPQKPKPLKLTPAELISRSPHMVPKYFLSPMQSFLNPSPGIVPFVCLGKTPNSLCPSPAIFLASPNVHAGTPMGMPQAFFPPDFSPNQFVAVAQMPVTNFFSNGNVNMDHSHS